jgi:hypothetical protein
MSWQNGDGGWTWEEGKEGCGETPPEEVIQVFEKMKEIFDFANESGVQISFYMPLDGGRNTFIYKKNIDGLINVT